MCILLATTCHPGYKLIIISNRDEFYERKTHATCWRSGGEILAPYDMSAAAGFQTGDDSTYGTWLGINRKGNVSVLLNLDEDFTLNSACTTCDTRRSRGGITIEYLRNAERNSWGDWNSYEKFSSNCPLVLSTKAFTLFYGDIMKGQFKVIDSTGHSVNPFEQECYFVISNNNIIPQEPFRTWKKVEEGKALLKRLVEDNVSASKEELLSKCFDLAATSQYDRNKVIQVNDNSVARSSIFLPPLKPVDKSMVGTADTIGEHYGTRSTIVILVDNEGHVTVKEHTIYDSDFEYNKYSVTNPKQELVYEFDI
ncbi:HCL305Cp [Eremothecium sinecaudum]|uniref:HCL305Cp n=1 Tax=Eremothecium sinecaudum TaxID=45286 RepID=A0A120K1Y9_9SACH|nr:HCL305Cp [Eremothecium sinecaudum]AMD19846.1 HCL305Cp [Eremothecium sinecaudum]